jgi:plasmid stabilization system protein ParE
MKYRVAILPRARLDLDDAYRWAAQRAPETALRWAQRFAVKLQELGRNPFECAVARESHRAGREIREMHFGKRQNVYRALYVIVGEELQVFRVIRAQRKYLTRRQIDEALGGDSGPQPAS